MNQIMASGHVRLKGRELLEKYGTSIYRLAKDGDISYPTAHKYITSPEATQQIDSEVLYGILTSLGMSHEQVLDMRFGDIFDLVPKKEGS